MRYPLKAFDAVAVSGTTTYYSTAADIRDFQHFSFHLFWTTNTGTFTVQVSNREAPDETDDDDWYQPTLAEPITQPSGTAGNHWIDLSAIPSRWLRLKYVNSSGSGVVSAFGQSK